MALHQGFSHGQQPTVILRNKFIYALPKSASTQITKKKRKQIGGHENSNQSNEAISEPKVMANKRLTPSPLEMKIAGLTALAAGC